MRRYSPKLAELLDRLLHRDSSDTPVELSESERESLEPLLSIAERLRDMPRLEPSEAAQERCLARLERETAPAARRPRHSPRRGLVLTFAACALVLLMIAGGVATGMAGSAMPGELMYPVKRAAEDIRLFLTKDAEGRVKWSVCLSQRRMEEFVTAAKSGDVRAQTLTAMLKTAQCAQMAAEQASDSKRETLITQVGQLCQNQGVVLQDMKCWISVKDTAMINVAIAQCAMCRKSCAACPSGMQGEPEQHERKLEYTP